MFPQPYHSLLLSDLNSFGNMKNVTWHLIDILMAISMIATEMSIFTYLLANQVSPLFVGQSGFPWRRKGQPTPVFLPGKSHEQRSLAGYGPWGHSVQHDWLTKQKQQKQVSSFVSYQLVSFAHFSI